MTRVPRLPVRSVTTPFCFLLVLLGAVCSRARSPTHLPCSLARSPTNKDTVFARENN